MLRYPSAMRARFPGARCLDFVRTGVTMYSHSSGACRMGKDDRAVVDAKLRVNGMYHTTCGSPTAPSCRASSPLRRCRPAC
ncbi:GMC oxidoreductase [Dactylosporangium sp. CA-139114]|uniref:GMC oxidoreductase n=1 Tax=Dactylosporangium sp. CA-139114 TaxID=3239931 RepID=UPI003D95167E